MCVCVGVHGRSGASRRDGGGRTTYYVKHILKITNIDTHPTQVSFAAVSAAGATDGAGLAPIEAFVVKALSAR